MNQILTRIMANKHTSGAAFAYGVLMLIGGIAKHWFPDHSPQIDSTLWDLQQFAAIYGLTMAGDAKPKPGDAPEADEKPAINAKVPLLIGALALLIGLTGCV